MTLTVTVPDEGIAEFLPNATPAISPVVTQPETLCFNFTSFVQVTTLVSPATVTITPSVVVLASVSVNAAAAHSAYAALKFAASVASFDFSSWLVKIGILIATSTAA